MEADKLNFELSFFEDLHRGMPKDVRIASMLAHLYTETGRIDQGLRIDRKLVRLSPKNPIVHYNLACSLALKNRKADALKSLQTAITLGYSDFVWMLNDPDLVSMHSYSGFKKMCADLRIKGKS